MILLYIENIESQQKKKFLQKPKEEWQVSIPRDTIHTLSRLESYPLAKYIYIQQAWFYLLLFYCTIPPIWPSKYFDAPQLLR